MKKLRMVLPHIISWGVALFIAVVANINFMEFDLEERKAFLSDNAPIWIFYVLFFYVCYLLLIPKLLFKKRYVWFAVSIVALYLGSFVLINRQKSHIFEGFILERIAEVSKAPDMPADKVQRITQKMVKRLEEVREGRNSINIFAPHSAHTSYTLFFLVAVSIGISSLRKWQDYKQAAEAARQQQLESELSYLKQQINPHFLFNALNSIYSLVISNANDAGDAVLKLSAILRYMLYETDKPAVSLKNEIDMIEDYLALQKLKSTGVTKVLFHYNGEIEHKQIPPLVLIPFIENAFKYGSDNVHDSFIDISVDVKDDELFFDIRNSVVCAGKKSSDGGIGIVNIKRRLEIMYPGKYFLSTKQQDNIYCVSLQIPLIL